MSPTMNQPGNSNSHSSTTALETAYPKLSIRTAPRTFDYLPPELTTPIPHLVSPGVHPPPNTASRASFFSTSLFEQSPMGPRSRFITPDPKVLDSLPLINPQSHLSTSLSILVTDNPPSAAAQTPARGLLSGPTSIAYLFLHLSSTHPTLDISTRTPSEWCREYLRAASTSHSRQTGSSSSSSSRRGGIQDEALAYAVVKAALIHSQSKAREFTNDANTYISRALHLAATPLDPTSHEWLYGRSGTLYLLRALKHFIPGTAPSVDPLLSSLVTQILTYDCGPEGPWTWHGKSYLGAAHGDIGIVTQCVLSVPSCVDTFPQLTSRIQGILEEQLPSGNWPSSRSSSSSSSNTNTTRPPRDELLQFCHGAPGVILSLLSLSPYLPSLKPAIDSAVRAAREATWSRGFLTKEPCLCHGIAGNALAMDRTRRERMLRMATPEVVGRGVVEEGMFVPGSDAYGLMWGEAGRAWVWAWMDGGGAGREGRLVGYNDV